MQRLRSVGPLVALLGIWSAALPAGPAHPPPGLSVKSLRWLAGCLELRSGDRVVEESRMDLRAGSMLGMGRTTSSKGLVDYELTLIREREGKILFEAHPSGQPAAVFTATSATADSVIFEAPEHDYPQIVGYRRSGRDSVIAWVDGEQGGKRQRIEFPYRRVACPGL
ncbi:MAG: hypothetical protein QOH59_1731 [Gemmatimonadales bacterium]|nr:hypothetical protein [Gemmatimonadales bacterium]